MEISAESMKALGIKRVILAGGKTDLRTGMYGLAALVNLHYGMDPTQGDTVWLFCGRRRDRVKALLFTSAGFTLTQLSLLEGVLQWPRGTEEAIVLDVDDFERFLSGEAVVPTRRRKHKGKDE